ncbi:MAG: MarR family transcriptional regulator [Ilumatobacteraceae bacterium]|nr:MarR family transcriptional regulator [Ilumatobacteraceae bacterium]
MPHHLDVLPTTSAPFRLERDMVAPLLQVLPQSLRLPDASLCRVLREVDLVRIIPDVLIGVWKGAGALPVRPRSDYLEAHILALLEQRRGWTADTLADELFSTRAKLARTLGRLERRGLVTRSERGGYALTPSWNTYLLDIIAVEVKLHRWREALAQATAYLEFANRAYVVLDGGRVDYSPVLIEAFQAAGVGLMLQYEHQVHQVTPAFRVDAIGVRRIHAADRLFGAARSVWHSEQPDTSLTAAGGA